MKRTNHLRRAAGAVALACALLLAGCGGRANGSVTNTASAYAADTAAEAGEAMPAEGNFESTLDPSQAAADRKMIYTADLSMESTDFDTTRAAILEAVEANGAYLEYTSQSGSSGESSRRVSYTVRVPAEHYRAFLAALSEAGNVLNMNESAQDITTSYIDVEARISALEKQRDRLNELAETAETTADLLEIESQLSEVQYQLESYTRQLRAMDNQVSYSTVEIYLREVAVLTPTSTTFVDRIGEAFTGGWRDFAGFLADLAVAAVYLLPFILIAVVILIPLLLLHKRRKEQRRAQRAARPAPPPAPGVPVYQAPPPTKDLEKKE